MFSRKKSIANIIAYKMKQAVQDSENGAIQGKSFFVFEGSSKFRKLVSKVVQSSSFDYVVLVVICIQSLLLALDNPLNDP